MHRAALSRMHLPNAEKWMIWSSDMDRLYIVIPAYNEEENIEQVIRDWHPVVERHSAEGTSRLVVIEDGSKDGTYKSQHKY